MRGPSFSPPPTPDPYRVAAAQSNSNVATAIATTVLANADEVSPQGSVTYTQIGSVTITEPKYDSNGNITGESTRTIPRYLRTISMTPRGQQVYDASQESQLRMAEWSKQQADLLHSRMGTPFVPVDLPVRIETMAEPSLNGTAPSRGALITSIGSTLTRESVFDAMNARIQYQINLDRDRLRSQLGNAGIFPGSFAYTNEMRTFDIQSTDARNQAWISAGQELSRALGDEVVKAKFANDAQAQEFQQSLLVIEFSNKVTLQRFEVLKQIADFINTTRERDLQEQLVLRQQPMNELSALMHGGQVSMPQFAQYKSAQIADVPVGQYIYNSSSMDMQRYKMRVDQQNAQMGGIAGIAGSLLAMPMSSGTSVGGALFGGLMNRFGNA